MLGDSKSIILFVAILSVSGGQMVPDEVSDSDSAVIKSTVNTTRRYSYEVSEESASKTIESDSSEEYYDERTNELDHYFDDVFEVVEESTSTTTDSGFNVEVSGDGPTEEVHDKETNEHDHNSDDVFEVPEKSTSTTTDSDFNVEFSGHGPSEDVHDEETNEHDHNSDEVTEETVGSEESKVPSSTTTENDFVFEESTETVLDKKVKTADPNMLVLWLALTMIGIFVGTSIIFVLIFYIKHRYSPELHNNNIPLS